MKKLIALCALALSSHVQGAAFDLYMAQMSADETGVLNRQLTVPNGGVGVNGVLYYDGTAQLPLVATMTGCSITSGVFSCAGTSQVNSDWNASSGVAQILNKPSLATVATSGAYADLSGKPTNVSSFTNDAGYVTGSSLSTTLSGYATTSALSSGLAGKYNAPAGTTAQYVRGDGSLATFPVTVSRSQASASRTLNSGFQISSTRDALANYSVQMTVTASIAGGQDGDLFFEIASDSGFTTNLQTVGIAPCSQSYTLAVALQGVQKCALNVSGYVPAAYFARLRTANNAGTPAFLYRAGQEVLL